MEVDVEQRHRARTTAWFLLYHQQMDKDAAKRKEHVSVHSECLSACLIIIWYRSITQDKNTAA